MGKYRIHFIREELTAETEKNVTLMEAMKAAGIFLDAPCGGRGTCGKCLVKISADKENWEKVKACQTHIEGDLEVDTQGSVSQHRILTSSRVRKVAFRPDLPPVQKQEKYYLAAFDIGTTTIAAYLLDGQDGRELCAASSLNPQAAYGADVISRANYNLKHGSQELADCIHKAIDELTGELAKKAKIQREEILRICLVGNTCMHHIFFQYPMDALARAPYEPYKREMFRGEAADFDIHIHPQGELVFLPVIAGFVGADTMGCVLTLQPDEREEITLMIDIGTNGELVLGNKERMICCSTAAGPAFEGAKIECGMRGAKGAIDHVSIQGDEICCSVICGGVPCGICGSGLIDAVACLRRAGLIEESGRLLSRAEAEDQGLKFAGHITEKNKMPAFLFDPANPDVYLSQKDIREVQLAKGAISAGLLLMEQQMGITHGDIRQVYIAGAFGNYMDPDRACDIGLLPDGLRGRITGVGNAAGEGAKIALMNAEECRKTEALKDQIEFLELAVMPQFQDCFVDELEFPRLEEDEKEV